MYIAPWAMACEDPLATIYTMFVAVGRRLTLCVVRNSRAGQSQPSPKCNQVRRKPAGQKGKWIYEKEPTMFAEYGWCVDAESLLPWDTGSEPTPSRKRKLRPE
jgi:hypothetical protein